MWALSVCRLSEDSWSGVRTSASVKSRGASYCGCCGWQGDVSRSFVVKLVNITLQAVGLLQKLCQSSMQHACYSYMDMQLPYPCSTFDLWVWGAWHWLHQLVEGGECLPNVLWNTYYRSTALSGLCESAWKSPPTSCIRSELVCWWHHLPIIRRNHSQGPSGFAIGDAWLGSAKKLAGRPSLVGVKMMSTMLAEVEKCNSQHGGGTCTHSTSVCQPLAAFWMRSRRGWL